MMTRSSERDAIVGPPAGQQAAAAAWDRVGSILVPGRPYLLLACVHCCGRLFLFLVFFWGAEDHQRSHQELSSADRRQTFLITTFWLITSGAACENCPLISPVPPPFTSQTLLFVLSGPPSPLFFLFFSLLSLLLESQIHVTRQVCRFVGRCCVTQSTRRILRYAACCEDC